jgi:hypothetical protein
LLRSMFMYIATLLETSNFGNKHFPHPTIPYQF